MVWGQTSFYLAPQVYLISNICAHLMARTPPQGLGGPLVNFISPKLEVCIDLDPSQLDLHAVIDHLRVLNLIIVYILIKFDELCLNLDLPKINNDSVSLARQ